MKKRGIALLLSLVMTASVVAGCGSSSSKSNGETSDTDAATVAAAAAEELTLPLCDEKTNISVWMLNDSTAMAKNGGDYNNNPYYKELEERTNVHIDWQVPAAQTESEQFNLLFTSGNLPDLMYYNPTQNVSYKDGLDAAVDDGYFLDLTELLPKYAPHYLAALEKSSDNVKKAAVTDEGRYVQIYSILQTSQPSFYGFVVRQDWLDELGLETPQTYEDWENMLKAFKEKKGCSAPLSTVPTWLWNLGAGMGVYNLTDFYQEGGKVKQALVDEPEKVREFLTLLNKWYTEGLLDPDFASETNFWGNSVLMSNDSTGVTCTMYTIPSALFLPSIQDENAAFSALKAPVANAGDKLLSGAVVPDTTSAWVISADCKNPELILKWIDYMYTDEGALFGNYGKEGETFTMGDDNKPVFTDVIANNPDGLSYDEAMRIYTYEPSWPGIYYNWERELQFVSEDDFKMCYVWDDFDHEATYYPSYASLNLEETAEYSDIFSDLSTYIQENLLSFVTGAKPLSEFDDFVSTVDSMNIKRVIELKQSALDRFNK